MNATGSDLVSLGIMLDWVCIALVLAIFKRTLQGQGRDCHLSFANMWTQWHTCSGHIAAMTPACKELTGMLEEPCVVAAVSRKFQHFSC